MSTPSSHSSQGDPAAPTIHQSADPQQLPFLLTVAEWRDYYRLSRSAAYGLIKSGGVPVVRIGRHIRIPRSVLEAK
jgi:excisionase family DNA binding protein